ncbi:class II glutamine amidotransferase [Archaeoglobus sp.]|uniref:class II glutamine amidotransferase n=1 Tax=Archaeoglobus sp. TaxID=1872626 RepID=UPI0024AC37EF|nr:class II glutamine amidotransferase [Archaeoglobus sp.]MDI3497314.1 hypothetical protein [Archaeoglobus sp.]
MCELFALSCNRKDRATFSLPLFARYHTPSWDGWGVGYYSGRHAVVERSTDNPNHSETFRRVITQAMSNVIVAHIRIATTGDVCTENCHPFSYRFLDRDWLFAHNGHIPIDYPTHVDGYNDSARAFSFMMDQMREYLEGRMFRGIYPAVKHATKALLETYGGNVNYLLTDGNVLFAFCNHRRMYMLRREKEYGGAILISTQKLSDENWVEIPKNRVLCVLNGEVLVTSSRIG